MGVQVAARTASISDEAIKLLDSRSAHGGRVPICPDDGVIKLSRRVVSVELAGGLEVDVLALHNKQLVDGSKGGLLDVAAADKVSFTPKRASTSCGICDLGFCKLEITVAWSLTASLANEQGFIY